MGIQTWIGEAMARNASDIHLQAGAPAMMRVDGAMCALNPQALDSASLWAWLQSFADAPWPSTLTPPLDCDGALTLPNLGRFRFNLMWHHHGLGMVLRPISGKVPTLKDLQCPAALADWSAQAHGLVLVTGPTGSGKSSTLAAMVDHINQHQSRHVITLEDPIEFVHTSHQGLVTQREIVRDTASFATGLRAALREDPDVIVVGELRDTESIPLTMDIGEYMKTEVLPHVPDAWVNLDIKDEKDGQVGIVGAEINFNREFYVYEAPRSRNAIRQDIEAMEQRFMDMLKGVAE